MSRFLLYALLGGALVTLALHALIVRRHLIVKLLALNIAGAGAFLLLISVAHRNRIGIPDPVPHAMVLTGIVVAVAITAFALALVRRLHAATGQAHLPDDGDDA